MGCFSFLCKESGLPVASDSYSGDAARSESDRNQGWGEPNGGRAKITEPMHIIYGR